MQVCKNSWLIINNRVFYNNVSLQHPKIMLINSVINGSSYTIDYSKKLIKWSTMDGIMKEYCKTANILRKSILIYNKKSELNSDLFFTRRILFNFSKVNHRTGNVDILWNKKIQDENHLPKLKLSKAIPNALRIVSNINNIHPMKSGTST